MLRSAVNLGILRSISISLVFYWSVFNPCLLNLFLFFSLVAKRGRWSIPAISPSKQTDGLLSYWRCVTIYTNMSNNMSWQHLTKLLTTIIRSRNNTIKQKSYTINGAALTALKVLCTDWVYECIWVSGSLVAVAVKVQSELKWRTHGHKGLIAAPAA